MSPTQLPSARHVRSAPSLLVILDLIAAELAHIPSSWVCLPEASASVDQHHPAGRNMRQLAATQVEYHKQKGAEAHVAADGS